MISVTSLLNPTPAESRVAPVPSSSDTCFSRLVASRASPRTEELPDVNFPPFEEGLDAMALQEIRRYRITPFGEIQRRPENIPYNTGKRDFHSKTGRECLDVFQYNFQRPGDSTEFTVMWDYKVGLVRMTHFFKCCGYSKTTPAKMLNQNPGLKDIAYSITGGAIKAQGYWMPYACAKAVCATFCYQIAGALIPLFGPDFPSECISPGEPRYGIMIIKPELINDTMRKAHELYQRYGNWGGACTSSPPARRPARAVSSRSQERHHYNPYPTQNHRDPQQQQQRVRRSRRGFYDENSYENRQQLRVISAPQTPSSEWVSHLPRPSTGPHPGVPTSTHPFYTYSERQPHRSAWTAVNNQPPSNSLDRYSLKRPLPSSEPEEAVPYSDWSPRSQAPNPWLTAIPRSPKRTTTASSPWTSQPGSANRSRAGSISSMTSQQHPQGRLPSPDSILPSPSSSMSLLASSNSSSPRPQLPPISKLCSLPVVPSGRRRLPNGRPFRVVASGEETTAHPRHEEEHSPHGVYQFSARYQRVLTPPSGTSPTMHDWSQRKPAPLSQPQRIAVEANMDGDDTESHSPRPTLTRTPSSTSLAANNDVNDTKDNINQSSSAHGRDEGQKNLAARKTAALTLLHLRQQEEEKQAAAAVAAAAASSSASPVSPPPSSGQLSPTLSALGTISTTTAVSGNTTEPSAPPLSPSSNYLGSPTSTSIASSSPAYSCPSSACNSTVVSRESSVTATATNPRREEGRDNDADDEDNDYKHEHEQEQHRRKRRRLLLVGRAKSF